MLDDRRLGVLGPGVGDQHLDGVQAALGSAERQLGGALWAARLAPQARRVCVSRGPRPHTMVPCTSECSHGLGGGRFPSRE